PAWPRPAWPRPAWPRPAWPRPAWPRPAWPRPAPMIEHSESAVTLPVGRRVRSPLGCVGGPGPGAACHLGYGVIGSPTGSGPVSLGSSPGTPAAQHDGADVGASALVHAGTGAADRRL